MLPKKTPNPVSSLADEPALPVLTDRARDFIATRQARGEPPERIAAALRALFEIEIDPAQVVPYWQGEVPTQTEPRPDKESVQFQADEEREPVFTLLPDGETPPAMSACETIGATQTSASNALDPNEISRAAPEAAAPATQTGHRQNADSLQIPADTVDEPTAHDKSVEALGKLLKASLGPDPAEATQTGPRQDQKKPCILTDEVKAFIVRGLARYETPSRVAASVEANFGLEIDRRQVFAYDPAGSRPPAQRWIDLHAATRAKFIGAMAEIGIAQKVVRLRMLDRLAHRAEAANYTQRTAKLLEQAAKECGGYYERYQRPKAAA